MEACVVENRAWICKQGRHRFGSIERASTPNSDDHFGFAAASLLRRLGDQLCARVLFHSVVDLAADLCRCAED